MEVVSAETSITFLHCRSLGVQVKARLNNNAVRERERERENREAQIILNYIIQMVTTTSTRLQKSVYILTNLGQLPFTLFTEIA